MKIRPLVAGVLASLAPLALQAAGTMGSTPEFPSISDAVVLKLNGHQWPVYIPTASYTRQGNVFTFDFDSGGGFDMGRPDMGNLPIAVGALPPGTYTAHARVTDLNNPSAPPQFTTAYFVVSAPFQPDAHAVPAQPHAYNRWQAVVSSAYYLYPTTLRASVSGNVVSVAFEYEPSASTGNGAAPAGAAASASIALDGLPPGNYELQFNGTPRGGSSAQLQYRKPFTIQRHSQVVEYYSDATGHYFVSGGPGEIASLDAPTSGWRRTGDSFNAWLSATDAPQGAVPVCRFYSTGANSHFYTASAAECNDLRATDQRERAGGKQFSGWMYEGIAFHALVPVNGACPADTFAVRRYYNNRWRENDSNHRFPSSSPVASAMAFASWTDEGIAFCSPR